MFKQLIIGTGFLISGISASYAQYFGPTLFVEGFDGDEFPSEWVQTSLSDTNTAKWELSESDKPKFSTIDRSSQRSAKFMLNGTDTKISLTSPQIDASGKENLQVGFYGYELSYCFRGNIDFRFRASHDGGTTWTDLFSSTEGSSYNGIPTDIWNLYKYELPEEFNGKQIILQFYVDASAEANPQSLAGYIDGVFVSLLPECDIAIEGINYSTNDRRPTSGVFGNAEPLILTLRNVGTHELTQAEAYYTINGGEEISESISFNPPLPRGQQTEYAFSKGIDLSAPRATSLISAGVRIEGDINLTNNEIKGYTENQVVTVPYIPPFISEEDGVTVTSTDEWTTFENNDEYGWDYEDWDDFYWYTETEWNSESNDAYLISRPIALKAGETYRLQFSALSEEEANGNNVMSVYVSTDDYMEKDLQTIWHNDCITEDNAINQAVLFSVPANGFYYIGFHSQSKPEASRMLLRDIALYRNLDKDAALVEVSAPVPSLYTYTDSENVCVKIANYGTSTIPSGEMQLSVSVDGIEAFSEKINQAISPNEILSYTLASTLDLSDLGTIHKVDITLILPGDEDTENNRTSYQLESDVADVPYIPDMGTQTKKGNDVKRWEGSDCNDDGYTFIAGSDAVLDSYSFNYGGGLYGFTTVTIPTSDDKLLSRHLRLESGKTYKLTYAARIGKEGGSIPLSISLLSSDNGNFAPVKALASTTVVNTTYTEFVNYFEVSSDGIYRLEFSVQDSSPIDYRIYLGRFRLEENLSKDLSLEEIILPSAYVSGIHNYPVGARIRNTGTETIQAFSLSASSKSTGIVTQKFENANLEPDTEYIVYFKDDFVFDNAESEILEIELTADGDEYTDNNGRSCTINYPEPYSLPYNPIVADATKMMSAFNLNRDAFRFVPSRMLGTGFLYTANQDTEASDYLATPAINLDKETPLRITFSYYVHENDSTDFEVFAYDASTDMKVKIADMHQVTQNNLSQYTGFFKVPEKGVYNICIQPTGKTKSLFINAAVTVEEAAGLPDLRVKGLASHTEAGTYSDKETVTIEFTSESDYGVQCVPFELEVGDSVYHSVFTKYTSRTEENDSPYQLTFENVDLFAPGEYSVKCRAIVPMDQNPDDNEKTATIVSLPVVDVAINALEAPASGKLSDNEQVRVNIMNKGKGSVKDITLKCDITSSVENFTPRTLSGTITEPIESGDSYSFTFDETVDMFDEGVYTFTLKAEAAGDINVDDNTLIISVNSTEKDFDAGVTDIISPVDNALSAEEHVNVRVANFSEFELFDVPVKVSVRHSDDEESQVLNGMIPNIPVGEYVEYTLPGTVDMLKCGIYEIIAATELENDADNSNDSCTSEIKCLTQDVGVTAILSPISGDNLGKVDVTVAVTNFGEADVDNIPMSYQIGSMPQLANMDDTLKAGDTKEFTFPMQYEFISFSTYTVKAMTMLTNDINPDNDSCEITIENRQSGIDNVEAQSVSVYPNPAISHITVSAGDKSIERIEIYDMNARMQTKCDANGATKVNMALNLPSGIYIVRVIDRDSNFMTTRLIIK